MGDQTFLAAAAVDEKFATIYVAIELSKKSWLVGIEGLQNKKVSHHKLRVGDAKGLVALIGRKRQELERKLGHEVRLLSCYEAGYDGFWLHRYLEARGIVNHVIDPASLSVKRRARRVKTDRLDVMSLLRALIAFSAGDVEACSLVRVPTVAQEDDKRLHRERQRVVKERTAHINRVKGLLACQGIYHFQPQCRDARARLAGLETGDGRKLPSYVKREIERELDRLELVTQQISDIEAARDGVAKAAEASSSCERKIQHLYRLRGIGPEFSTVLVGEIFYRSFGNRRELGAYAGLTGSPYNSGKVVREQGLSKAGNPRLRTTMVELAWLWLRYQPKSALSQWFKERLGGVEPRRFKRILIVALARKLLIALWRYLETGVVPQGAIMKVY